MAKRGRKPCSPRIFDTLSECVQAAPQKYSGEIYRVELLGQVKYLWATSKSNSVRLAAYGLGATSIKVSVSDVVAAVKEGEV